MGAFSYFREKLLSEYKNSLATLPVLSIAAFVFFIVHGVYYTEFLAGGSYEFYLDMVLAVISLSYLVIDRLFFSNNIYRSLYFIISLIFVIPAYFTYMLLLHGADTNWQYFFLCSFFLLANTVSSTFLGPIALIGILLGVGSYGFSTNIFIINMHIYSLLLCILGACIYFYFVQYVKHLKLCNKVNALSLGSATIAHELRSPLASLRLNALCIERKLSEVNSDVSTKESLLKINNSVQRMSESLESMLANMNMNDYHAISKKFYAEDSIKLALDIIPSSCHQVLIIQAEDNVLINGDPIIFSQVISNLILNAYQSLGKAQQIGKILLDVVRLEGQVVVSVVDSAGCLKMELLPYIFDPYFTTKKEGSGVGLAFCKKIIESMKGSINCYVSPDKYTALCISIGDGNDSSIQKLIKKHIENIYKTKIVTL